MKPYTCQRCGYQWFGRTGRRPVACPNRPCQSRRWDQKPAPKVPPLAP